MWELGTLKSPVATLQVFLVQFEIVTVPLLAITFKVQTPHIKILKTVMLNKVTYLNPHFL